MRVVAKGHCGVVSLMQGRTEEFDLATPPRPHPVAFRIELMDVTPLIWRRTGGSRKSASTRIPITIAMNEESL
jgi:hypothetical protein